MLDQLPMTLSYDQTKDLIELALKAKSDEARDGLFDALRAMKREEPEFYAGVVEHGPSMNFTSEQWFDLFSKVTTRVFRDEDNLMSKLSEDQRLRLPPATLG